ncbi:MAG TPA: glycosyltransferase, partial [Thermoplasmata archaeon]|nr:glycosyltransferase [Thermoplasmata archaeon]
SRDRTVAIAEEFRARHPDLLRIVVRGCSRGGGRNVGVAEARGEYVAFIDGDCIADSGWLGRLRLSLGPSTVVAGRTVAVGKPRYGALERVELFQGGYDVTYPSCNLVYPRALFERLGGFDTRFITAEDIDLNLRAVRAGASIRYDEQAVVLHHMRATFVRFLYQAFWNGYGRKQLTEKQGNLWGRYRYRRLLRGQRTAIAWARLTAAVTGYFFRVVTGEGRRLDLQHRAMERVSGAADDGSHAGPDGN